MTGQRIPTRLSNGAVVELAQWEDVAPPRHLPATFAQPWDAEDGRDRLKFYDATVHYMRNTPEVAPPSVAVHSGRDHLLLFYSERTDSWHSAEALDVDHIKPCVAHLQALGVNNLGDALIAYNDVDNLRLVPSAYNRARDSADAILDTHGVQSPQWAAWSRAHFGFDPDAPRPAYDPAQDRVQRSAATQAQDWPQEKGRDGLGFDAAVRTRWFEQALHDSYVGSVPIHDDESGRTWQVPLFRCAATEQLVTRDGLDIDHREPFERRLQALYAASPDGTISKAQALDEYNDTGNLRLVSRAANSSHEWELDEQGQYRDADSPSLSRGSASDEDWIVDDGDALDPALRAEIRAHFDPMPPQAVAAALDAMQAAIPASAQNLPMEEAHPRDVLMHDASIHDAGMPDAPLAMPPPPIAAQAFAPVPRLDSADHPDHALYAQTLRAVNEVDPIFIGALGEDARERVAAALSVQAKEHGLAQVDRVVSDVDGQRLFAMDSRQPSYAAPLPRIEIAEALGKPIERSSREMLEIAPREDAQAAAPARGAHSLS